MAQNGEPRQHLAIALPMPEPTDVLDRLRKQHPHMTVSYHLVTPGQKVPLEFWKPATIICTLFALPEDPEKDAPFLKLVHLISAGCNQIIASPIYKNEAITITTSNGVHGPQIAEWVVMTTLVLSHSYRKRYEEQKQHVWNSPGSGGDVDEEMKSKRSYAGQRVGVLGYGSIGRQVGRLFKALGSQVLAYTASPKPSPESRRDNGYIVPGTGDIDGTIPDEWYSGLDKDSLHKFLAADLDLLVVTLPSTTATKHFLGAEEFKILGKRQAVFSNVSRGNIVKQDDLIEALKNGTLRAAALDVTDPEPLPADNALWDMDNVVITAHNSGLVFDYLARTLDILNVNLERLGKGEQLINVVSRERGY